MFICSLDIAMCYQLEQGGSKEHGLDDTQGTTSGGGCRVGGLPICTSGRRQLCLVAEVVGFGVSLGGIHPTTLRA